MSSIAPEKSNAGAQTKTADGHWVEYDHFIEDQLRKTRGEVKGVEIATGLMTLAAGSIVYFLLVALADHWVLPHGLGFWGRPFCLALFLGGAGYYAFRQLLPPILLRINPIYAAHTIENSRPSLKNSLINFLLLRDRKAAVPRAVFEGIERQAATGLSHGTIESAVDRTPLLHIGYVLLGVFALFAAYSLFSPKSPLETVGRVIMPWADIQAPTRIAILDVQPGDCTVYNGQVVEISGEMKGVVGDEPVRLVYSTADRQAVDREVTMHVAPGAYRHTARLPVDEAGAEDPRGVQQDIDYRIEAGDAISPTYRLHTEIAPTIAVDQIDYEYPKYTRRSPQHLEKAGDIEALEGTRVTIHGHANQALKRADLELLSGDGQTGDGAKTASVSKQSMQISGQSVTVSFTLAMDENDRTLPKFSRYRLRPDGRALPEPVEYRISVIRDLPPEIAFLAPESDDIPLPANGRKELELRALDPDFALTDVTLWAESNGSNKLNVHLLKETLRGPFQKKFLFDPADLRLKEGDVVEYWATARDNRDPSPNETSTARRKIRITKADRRQPPANQLAKHDRPPKAGDQNSPDDKPNPGDAGQNPQKHDAEHNNPNDSGENQDQPQDNKDQTKPNQDKQNSGDGSKQGNPKEKPPEGDSKQQEKKSGGDESDKKDQGQSDPKEKSSDEQGNKGSKSGSSDKGDKGTAQGSDSGSSGDKPQNDQQPGKSGDQGNQQSGADGSNGSQSDQQQSGSQSQSGSSDSDALNQVAEFNRKQDAKNQQNQPQPQSGDQPKQPESNQQQPSGGPKSDQPQSPQSGDKPQGDQKQPGGEPKSQSGNQQNPGQPKDSASPDKPSNEQGAPGSPKDDKPGANGKADNKQPGDPKAGQQPGAGKEPGKQSGSQSGAKDPAGGQPGSKQPGEKEPSQGNSTSQKGTGQKSDGHPETKSKPDGEEPNGAKPDGSKPGDASKSGAKSPASADKGDKEKSENKPGASNPSAEGQGDRTAEGSQPDGKKEKPNEKSEQRANAKGGDTEAKKGNPGAGRPDNDDKGAPGSQEGGDKPKDNKSEDANPGAAKKADNPNSAKSPSTTKKESNAQSDSDAGDRAAGGQAGGGQEANQAGTGGPGHNTASDSGSGRAEGKGDGETGSKKGDKKESDHATGHAGTKAGNGSTERNADPNHPNKAPTPANSPDSKPSPKSQPAPSNTPSPGGTNPGQPGGNTGIPQGGSEYKGNPNDPAAPAGATPDGDDPNLNFAKKQFDLALESLKKGDPKLLKEMNWTKEQAAQLAQRLEQMQKEAAQPGPKGEEAKRRQEELLRNLGAHGGQVTRARGQTATDAQHGNNESGDSEPPAEYRDQVEAYQSGISNGGGK